MAVKVELNFKKNIHGKAVLQKKDKRFDYTGYSFQTSILKIVAVPDGMKNLASQKGRCRPSEQNCLILLSEVAMESHC